MMPSVMVTGAGGFLGSHIAERFASSSYDVTAVGRFATEFTRTPPGVRRFVGMTLPDRRFVDAVKRSKPDILVHCAGTASVPDSVAHPYADFQRTVDVCAFVLESLRTESPRSLFILLSSAAVYGNPETQPIVESTPTKPVSPYGYHKLLCELLARESAELHGVEVAILRIFSAYGIRQRKQVIHDLFMKLCGAGEGDVELMGTGNETRDFIHARDVATSVELIAKERATGVFNLASGESISISSLAAEISHALDSRKPIVFTGTRRKGDPVGWKADIGRLRAMGFRPAVPLRQGLAEYADWYRQHCLGAH